MNPGDELVNAGLRESLLANGIRRLQAAKPGLQVLQFSLCFLVLCGTVNHRIIFTLRLSPVTPSCLLPLPLPLPLPGVGRSG